MRDYFLGLDMGTSSVGWAVTDMQYNLLKARRKDLWGIREFEEASTSVERRTHRTSRRRRQREQVRIGLLKDYFHDAVMSVDPLFFIRLDNSKYHLEDKDVEVQNKNGIFRDENYTDKEYYKEYPTIFHLRKELMDNSDPHDVRLVYLALVNMFKHRGHFLNAGLSSDEQESNIQDAYELFVHDLKEATNISFPQIIDIESFEGILSDRNLSRTQKAERISALVGVEKKAKREMLFVKVLCGLKGDARLLFEEIGLEDKLDICFADYGYEEKIPDILNAIGEENYHIIERMKQIYDIGSLAGILKGKKYLSEARVEDYEKHHSDLKKLQAVIRKYGTFEVYNQMFRSDEAGSYSAYVGSYNSGGKVRRNMKNRGRDDFYKKVKSVLKEFPQDEEVIYIQKEMDKETFMPKQLTSSNGVIPNQIHAREMKKILKNAGGYLPFLNEKDESGLTTAERILQLFSFQIPYYVGPVSENSMKSGGNGWVVRKEKGQVLPWNIEDKIDIAKTSEKFISRLVRRCSYLEDEKVLPKSSLLYEKFCVLNEINNIKIDGEKIPVSLKQDIYHDLFEKGKKVTRKQLAKYLIGKGKITEEVQISGIDQNMNNWLSSYGKFHAILGDKMQEDDVKAMVESIIFWCTVYGDAKSILHARIQENYGSLLTERDIKRIMGYKFKDWGRLSREFLELAGCDKSTGEIISLIQALWNTQDNLMELLHSDAYTFRESLEEKQQKSFQCLSDFKPEDMEEMYFSAPVKRMVWQTISLIREIEQIMGGAPKRLFIEMTRTSEEKGDAGRKNSRKKQLLDLYSNIQDELHSKKEWKDLIEQAEESGRLRSKKMYLYIKQMGRSMYSGKPIDLDQLFNDNLYDIDHIYPRHFVKDDNLENNLVLVEKETNANKSDVYPLDISISSNSEVKTLWKRLHQAKLINDEKYNRLTNRTPFTPEQKAGFIARQLVETGQGTKGVADLLKQLLPETKLVYSKASNVSEFRQKRGIVKSRIVNDFHHAHDAYLNIVVGNVYFVKFTDNPLHFIKEKYAKDPKKYEYNLGRMFDWDVKRGEEVAWIAGTKEMPGTIATVKRMLAKNTPLMTRWNFENHGAIANETLYGAKKAKAENYIPLKTMDGKMQDVTKYGGFTSASTAYFFLVEHEVKGKKVRTLETVPIYRKAEIEKSDDGLLKYCEESLGLIHPSIRMKKIKIQSLVRRNGYFMYISGKTGNQIIMRNAVNLCLSQEWITYIKLVEKYVNHGVLVDKPLKSNGNKVYLTKERNEYLYQILLTKHQEGIYRNRPNPVGEKLQGWMEIFDGLALEEQCVVLAELLKLTMIGLPSADLSILGGAKKTGVTLISKNITDEKEVRLINQSVTGVYENSIDLLTI